MNLYTYFLETARTEVGSKGRTLYRYRVFAEGGREVMRSRFREGRGETVERAERTVKIFSGRYQRFTPYAGRPFTTTTIEGDKMHSKDRLAEVLRGAGLGAMADKASQGYYHDFMSPLAFPAMQLSQDLSAVGTPEALAIRDRHVHQGEFDAEEGE